MPAHTKVEQRASEGRVRCPTANNEADAEKLMAAQSTPGHSYVHRYSMQGIHRLCLTRPWPASVCLTARTDVC